MIAYFNMAILNLQSQPHKTRQIKRKKIENYLKKTNPISNDC
jgi:hypothetical protein